ncbi:MAG: AMP-binding protein, partial [Alicyclobacillus mali]
EGRELPPGTEGNFQVKTPAMFVTYLHHPEWYEAAMTPDGFFDTGDLAVIDEGGYLRITGRKKDVVNRGGEKIPVVEIEDLLYQHPDIADAAVVAMPDERLGERACAYVVLKPGAKRLELCDITDFLGERGMAKIYWPERLEIIDEMPRTASGKIQKYVLRQDIQRKLERERAEKTG